MNRSRILFFLISAVVVFPLLAATLVRAADKTQVKPEDDSLYKYLSVFSEILGLVRQAYVDEPDMSTLHDHRSRRHHRRARSVLALRAGRRRSPPTTRRAPSAAATRV